jgi:hypothetical protein
MPEGQRRRVVRPVVSRRLAARTAVVGSAFALSISGVALGTLAGGAAITSNRSAAYPQPTVELAQPAAEVQVGAAFSLTATVTEGGLPQVGRLVTFSVTGANPQTAASITNEAGHAAFTYVGQAAGTDHIVASFLDRTGKTIRSNEVTQSWTAPLAHTSSSPLAAPSTIKVLPITETKLSAPALGKTVNAKVISGVVFVKLPPGAHPASAGAVGSAFESLSKGAGFIPLTEARQIPIGSTLDTTAGVAELTTATSTSNTTQVGDFGAGIFTILQDRKQRGLVNLNIINIQTPRQACATVGKKATTAAKHLSSKVLGRLDASAKGKYTTRGQYSAATVRGTIWNVINRCDGTLTQVPRGIVFVRDFARRKTITLHTGQHYLAKAR